MSLLSRRFHDAASALAYSLAQLHANTVDLGPPFNDLTQFILSQHGRMPDYLQTPLRFATLAFDFPSVHGRVPEKRADLITAWKNSPIGFKRDLIRYFESLALFALYSRERGDGDRPAG